MALNMLVYGDNRYFEDILKLFLDILKYENVGSVEKWDQYNLFSLKEDRTKQTNWQVPFF